MRLFYPFTRDRQRKVIGPCWYGQDICSEQFLRVSDLNEVRSEAQRGPKKGVLKTPENTFLCISDHLRPTLFFAPYKTFFFQIVSMSRNQGIIPRFCTQCDFM